MLINIKMPTIVGILTFMSRINFVLNLVEYENSFITSGQGHFSPGSSLTGVILFASNLSTADFFFKINF